jgi:hypothetical protein
MIGSSLFEPDGNICTENPPSHIWRDVFVNGRGLTSTVDQSHAHHYTNVMHPMSPTVPRAPDTAEPADKLSSISAQRVQVSRRLKSFRHQLESHASVDAKRV